MNIYRTYMRRSGFKVDPAYYTVTSVRYYLRAWVVSHLVWLARREEEAVQGLAEDGPHRVLLRGGVCRLQACTNHRQQHLPTQQYKVNKRVRFPSFLTVLNIKME